MADVAEQQAAATQIHLDAALVEIEALNEALAEYEEKVEFLTEAEDRWREKNSKLRIQRDTDLNLLDQARMNRCDLEDRCRPLDKNYNLARKQLRRWGMSWDIMGELVTRKGNTEALSLVVVSWRVMVEEIKNAGANQSKRKSQVDIKALVIALQERIVELEEQVAEIPELQEALTAAENRIETLEGICMKQGEKTLRKVFGMRTVGELAKLYFSTWVKITPALIAERELRESLAREADLESKYLNCYYQLLALQDDIENNTSLVTARRALAVALDRQNMLQSDLDSSFTRSRSRYETIQRLQFEHRMEMKDCKDVLRATQLAFQAELAEVKADWEKRYGEMEKHYVQEVRRLTGETDELEARVDDLLEALYPDGAPGDDRSSRPPRVVPRSRGTLCAGCMTQILHRDIVPLRSTAEVDAATPERQDRERSALFAKTLGQPDPHNSAQAFMWHRRKDPSNNMVGARAFREVGFDSEDDALSPLRLHQITSRQTSSLGETSVLGRPKSATALGKSASLGRPKSATALGKIGKADALREEVAGFRKDWRK